MLNDRRAARGELYLSETLFRGNLLLSSLPLEVQHLLARSAERLSAAKHETLVEPGHDVVHAYFPSGRTIVALTLPMKDGRAVEAATVGWEGAVGGIVSLGFKPAFARVVVRSPGELVRIPIQKLEEAKRAEPKLHDALSRYADCLIAQILQSVACASVHPLEARCARWLLMTHDRLQEPDLPMTQEALADVFGVARTYMIRIIRGLEEKGAISHQRGSVRVEDRSVLENSACECYGLVRGHFRRILPGVYPTSDPRR